MHSVSSSSFSQSYSSEQDKYLPLQKIQQIWTNIEKAKPIYVARQQQNNHLQKQKRSQSQSIKNHQTSSILQSKLNSTLENNTLLLRKLNQVQQRLQELDDKEVHQMEEDLKRIVKQQEKQINQLKFKVQSLEYELSIRGQKNNEIRNKHSEYMEQIMENKQYFQADKLLELEEAKQTIKRAMQLLKSVPQYRQFVSMYEQNGHHFLKRGIQKLRIKSTRRCSCEGIKIDQRLLWVPSEAYRIMLSMKMKYDYLNEDCIEQVLLLLNRIWMARQQSRVNKLRGKYEMDINNLKKKSEWKYDQVVANRKIDRMKKELRKKKKNKENLPVLKIRGQYEDQLKVKSKQIRLLTQRIKILEDKNKEERNYVYYQGSMWILEKVIKDFQSYGQGLNSFYDVFRNSVGSYQSVDEWLRAYKRYFETIEEMFQDLQQKLYKMKNKLHIQLKS